MGRLARRLLLGLLFVLLVAAVGTFVPRPFFAPAESATGQTRRILVLSNPIHTDIAIPLDAGTRSAFGFLTGSGVPVDEAAVEWLVFGWGGRAFYLETPTWSELKPLPVIRALTLDRSVLHVQATGDIPETHPSVSSFALSEESFGRLLAFIQASFTREAGGVVPVPGFSYGSFDRFFEASGYFNALLGCNTWTAGALRAAGLQTGLWNPTPQTLDLSLRLFN